MRVDRLEVRNVEDLERATGGRRDFRPTQLGPRDMTGRLSAAAFDRLMLTYGKWTSDVHVTGTLSNEKLSVGVVLPATSHATVLGKRAKSGDLVVIGKRRENDARYRSELEYAVVNVDERDLMAAAGAEGLTIPRSVLRGSDLLRPEPEDAARIVRRMSMISEAVRSESLRSIGRRADGQLADEILIAFARALSRATRAKGLVATPGQPLPSLVRRAESWLRSDPSAAPRIGELSRVLAVSPRQLHRAFHAEVEMSPAKYLKRHRMTQARLSFVKADPAETTVTTVAHHWGFWELGRFAVEYRQLFGECPSTTLRRRPPARLKGRRFLAASLELHEATG